MFPIAVCRLTPNPLSTLKRMERGSTELPGFNPCRQYQCEIIHGTGADPQKFHALVFNHRLTKLIIFLLMIVDLPVDFQGQLEVGAVKVDDEPADDMLPSEFETHEFSVSDFIPYQLLGWRPPFPQVPCDFNFHRHSLDLPLSMRLGMERGQG